MSIPLSFHMQPVTGSIPLLTNSTPTRVERRTGLDLMTAHGIFRPDFLPPQNSRNMADNPTDADKQKITELGRAFGKDLVSAGQTKAMPDQSFQFNVIHKFLLGKVSLGNVTSVGYSVGNQYRNIFRAGYEDYNVVEDHPDTSYYFYDDNYSTKTKLNGLFNWLLVFGNNQKIEFRNFFNQISDKTSLLRDGRDFYGGSYKRGTELGFQSRSIYSGQLSSDLNLMKAEPTSTGRLVMHILIN